MTSRFKRITAIAAGAAALLVAGGMAIGIATTTTRANNHSVPASVGTNQGGTTHPAIPGQEAPPQAPRLSEAPSATGALSTFGSASGDEIVAVASAAQAAAQGHVTSIDAVGIDTWKVELTTSTGDQTEVRVHANGSTTILSRDYDWPPAHTLDPPTIHTLVKAALSKADGLITELNADSNTYSPYDVTVRTADHRSLDLEFSSDFAIVEADLDD